MEDFCKYHPIYSSEQSQKIASEFLRLQDQHYLEHAGATLYSEKQIADVYLELSQNLYANPHAKNLSSKITDDTIDLVRFQILQHFNTTSEEYSVIFTSGTTASLKLLAESFDYKKAGQFVYLQDNHTSVLGMRQYAKHFHCLPIDESFDILSRRPHASHGGASNSLFVYPAQSNFSGTKYPLSWVSAAQRGALSKPTGADSAWFVCLDAAALVGTSALDLSAVAPDFVTVSFYKLFGHPTGLGALLVRAASAPLLLKRYFGGGAVQMAQALDGRVAYRQRLHERFEDGTAPFLAIAALRQGFETLRRLGLGGDRVARHTFALARHVYRSLLCAHHANGAPVAVLYHSTTFDGVDSQGPIVNFNLLRENGEFIGYSEVASFAELWGVQLRTGCFCNQGACQFFLGLSTEDVQRNFTAGHVCGDQYDLIGGRPTGSVRVSFGYMSTIADADHLLKMIDSTFIRKPKIHKLPANYDQIERKFRKCFSSLRNTITDDQGVPDSIAPPNPQLSSDRHHFKASQHGILEKIYLYPVKSCAAFSVQGKWAMTQTGLKYDREWMIVNSGGVCVTQKHNKSLCLIRPIIDTGLGTLTLSYGKSASVQLSLEATKGQSIGAELCQSKVCGDQIQGWDCGDKVAAWLSNVLKIPGLRLLRQQTEVEQHGRCSNSTKPLLSLSNKAQYLLVNKKSVEWLRERIPEENALTESVDLTVDRFRANFIVNFGRPFVENDCMRFEINRLSFESGGKCTRCQMICIDQTSGKATKEPLQTLSREFKGSISFGVYLNRNGKIDEADDISLSVGTAVIGRKIED